MSGDCGHGWGYHFDGPSGPCYACETGSLSSDGDVQRKLAAQQHKRRESAKVAQLQEMVGATGQFPDGKLNAHDEGELKIAVATRDHKVVLAFGKPVAWIGMNPDDARVIAVSLMNKANDADLDALIRVEGSVLCEVCGDTYRHHPHDMKQLDANGEPFLRVRCDGRRLKL